jgi:hypothetical protein
MSVVPVAAAAANPEMMSLVMPDASTVMEINVSRIAASPFGATVKEAFHQGMAAQMKAQLAKTKSPMQDQLAMLGDIDWSQEVQDILVARGPGKHPATLVLVKTALDLERLKSFQGFSGEATVYDGVPILSSTKPENGAIAFLGDSIVAAGQMADVKAAIHRRGQPASLTPALAAQVNKYKQDDVWVASTELISGPLTIPGGAAAKAPAAAKAMELAEKIAGVNGGLRFSPDFDLLADVEARTEKGAAELSQTLGLVTAMMKSQARTAGGHAEQPLKFSLSGKHLLLSVHVPEAQMRAGLQQMRMASAAAPAKPASGLPTTVAGPSSGMAPPPVGTIRVQSSEGTVLIPVDRNR